MSNDLPTIKTDPHAIIEELYGTTMLGHLGLWSGKTKKTQWFNIDTLNQLAFEIQRLRHTEDLYLSVSTQEERLPTTKRGNAETVAQVLFFFGDVDFANEKDSDKNYPPDEKTSLSILKSFPHNPTLIQRSGNGLHVFWKCEDPIQCNNRKARSRAKVINRNFQKELASHFKSYGYQIDDVGDITRLVRIPGTFNHKSNPPKPVEVISYSPQNRIDPYEFDKAESGKSITLLPSGKRPHDQSADYELIKQECGWLRDVAGNGASTCSEPDWFSVGSILAGCENGEDIYHDISSKHPKYKPAETQQKFNRALETRVPHTCSHISNNGNSERFCNSCPHFEKGLGPLDLGKAFTPPDMLTLAKEGLWAKNNRSGQPVTCYQNAYIALLKLNIDLKFDLFRLRITVNGHLIQEFAGDMSDDALAALRKIATDAFGFDPGKSHLADAAHSLALENAFHPIRDYIDSLKWDGVERLSGLLHRYFGAEDTEINSIFSNIVTVAAVRRVRQPGCKFDTMLILEGPQGSGKSTAIKELAGEDNFSDQPIIGSDPKTQGELVQGVWLFECAEMSGLRHTDTNDLKSFLSRDTDRYRAAYARFTNSYRRQCIFIGTTNDETYLKDVTGNRRFWPVLTSSIDLESLRRDRDQLWAEAGHLEALGYSITLPEQYREAAAALQAERLPYDPWLDELTHINGADIVNGEMRISTQALFSSGHINIPPNQRKDFHAKRLSRVMGELGWDGPKALRIDGKAQRGYSKPVDPDEETRVEY